MTKWKLAPVEPTPEMIDAWNNDDSDEFRHAYHVMLEAAPHPPAFDHDAMDVFAANRFHVKPCDKRLFGWQVTAGDGEQTLYVGRKPDCENVARKLAGAFLDGAFYYSGLANAPQPPALSDGRILEIYEEAKANWNAQADQCNQWSDLGVDEVVTLVARAIEREILGGGND